MIIHRVSDDDQGDRWTLNYLSEVTADLWAKLNLSHDQV